MDSQTFANNWIESWNSHNLDRILDHYSEDILITTPMIKLATGGQVDFLEGKEAVRAYWKLALIKFPDLHFELVSFTTGVGSVALYYKSVMGKMAIETMFFNSEEKVNRMFAFYTS